MNLFRIIIFFGLGLMILSCAVHKYNRIVSSQFEDEAILPEGMYEGYIINKRKFEEVISKGIHSISRVYDLSIKEERYLDEVITFGFLFPKKAIFTVSFTAETIEGIVYEGIHCRVQSGQKTTVQGGKFLISATLKITGCANSEGENFDHTLVIRLSEIAV